MSFHTPLAKVKGLGSAKSGTSHYVHQRISAVFLIGLVSWALYFFAQVARGGHDILNYFNNFHLVASVLFIGAFLYHGYLGMRVVFEDYIHCKCMLNTSLIVTKAICLVTFVAYVYTVCVIKSHSMFIEFLK